MDPERRYRKRYSEIEVRLGDKEIRFRIGIDRNGVRTGSDTCSTSSSLPSLVQASCLSTFNTFPFVPITGPEARTVPSALHARRLTQPYALRVGYWVYTGVSSLEYLSSSSKDLQFQGTHHDLSRSSSAQLVLHENGITYQASSVEARRGQLDPLSGAESLGCEWP